MVLLLINVLLVHCDIYCISKRLRSKYLLKRKVKRLLSKYIFKRKPLENLLNPQQ